MNDLTVGEVRRAICQWAGDVPAVETTHYVIVVHDEKSGAASILYCCDDERNTKDLLQRALVELAGHN